MKIGFARRGYSRSGGAEAYLLRFAKAMEEMGIEPILFGSSEWPQSDWPGGQIVPLPGRSPLAFAEAMRNVPKENYDFLFSMERLWECDIYRAGDGVHRAWLERRQAHEPFWKSWGRFFNGKHRELLKLEASLYGKRGAKRIIANSEMVKREIVEWYHYDPAKISVVYNGLSSDYTTSGLEALRAEGRALQRASLGLKEDDYAVLFVGSGWERKGLRFAIEAMPQVEGNTVLLVAGRGSRKGLPKHDRVQFLGPVKEMKPLYSAADAFILPTLYDPFSNASLEALAMGLPVITTQANGFAEVIRPGVEGEVLADPRETNAVAKAINAWNDSERRQSMRPILAKLGASFSIESNVEATVKLIREMSAGALRPE